MKLSWIQSQMAQEDRVSLERRCERYYNVCVKMNGELEERLAKALGYPHDPEYGWVVGDHDGFSLLGELLKKHGYE